MSDKSAPKVALDDFFASVGAAVEQVRRSGPFGFPGHITIGIIFDPDTLISSSPQRIQGLDFARDSGFAQRFAELAGAFHGAFLNRFLEFNALTLDQKAAEASKALDDLRASGVLTGSDTDHITQTLGLLSDSSRTAPEIARAVVAAAQKYRAGTTSLLGVTLTNIALDSSSRAAERIKAGLQIRSGVAQADVMGGLVGAGLGTTIGGFPEGTIIGGGTGALLASMAAEM